MHKIVSSFTLMMFVMCLMFNVLYCMLMNFYFILNIYALCKNVYGELDKLNAWVTFRHSKINCIIVSNN